MVFVLATDRLNSGFMIFGVRKESSHKWDLMRDPQTGLVCQDTFVFLAK
jgi:hypothetical protein